MRCSTQTFMQASMPVQPSQLSNAAARPSSVSRQPSSAIVTSVRPSSSGSKVIVTVVSYDEPCWVSSLAAQCRTIRRFGSTSTTWTGKAPGKSAKSHVTVAPVSRRPLAPPVVK